MQHVATARRKVPEQTQQIKLKIFLQMNEFKIDISQLLY
jgi:hypothetical protein